MTTTNNIPKNEKQPALTEGAKRLRLKFVHEYSRDRDEFKACIRMGYQRSIARQFAEMFMACAFVLDEIEKAKVNTTIEYDLAALKQWTHTNLMETVATSTGSAKVAALAKFMELHKLVDTKQDNNNAFSFQMILDKGVLDNVDGSTSET